MKAKDGFVNFVSKVGVGANNSFAAANYVVDEISRQKQRLENIYRTSWLAGTIVNAVAEDMTRAGVDFLGDFEPAREAAFQKYLTKKGFWACAVAAIKWARLYGGCLLVADFAGADMAEPLDFDRIPKGSLRGFKIFDRWQLLPMVDSFVFSKTGAPEPEFYYVANAGLKIHNSRCFRFFGNELPPSLLAENDYWGVSVLESILDKIIYFDNATAGAAQLVEKAHLRVVQVDGLREVLAAGGIAEENLIKMFSQMRYLQNNEGVTLLDKNDAFLTQSYGFSGIKDIVLMLGEQIAGASGIPLVRLFGQSPQGLNSTGESDLRFYYDNILSLQESRLRENFDRLFELCYRSAFGDLPPADFDFEFRPLWQESRAQKLQNAQVLAGVILNAFNAGVIGQDVALAELKKASIDNGVFSMVDDDLIENAKIELPPDVEL